MARLMHIAFNMYALFRFGPGLERFLRTWSFPGIVSGGWFCREMWFLLPCRLLLHLGSSTAIFGLLGAEGVFLYQNRKVFGRQTQRALQQVIMLAVINLAIGFSPGIDNWGHLGGLIGGVSFAWLAGPLLHVEGIYPTYALVDARSARHAWMAALGVGGVFVLLVMVLIFMRSG